MEKLMELNGGKHRDFLGGQEEADAFSRKEYVRLHKSTMSKAYWFKAMYHKLQARKILTTRSNWRGKINNLTEKSIVKLLGVVAIFFTIFQLGQALFHLIKKPQPAPIANPTAPQTTTPESKPINAHP
jgi:hypothetical protein